MIRSWQRGTKTPNVFVKVAYHPALAVIPTTSIVDTAEIRLHENASCLFVSSRFVEPPDSPTADREKKEKMWKRSRRGNKRRGGAGCQEIPLGSGFGKNEAKSENSILRAYFVQTRPPEFNHRPDCWPILGGPRQESAANPRICHSRVAFEWPIVCLWDPDIDAASCESSDFRDSPGVEGEVDRYADVGFHLDGRGWALLPWNYWITELFIYNRSQTPSKYKIW